MNGPAPTPIRRLRAWLKVAVCSLLLTALGCSYGITVRPSQTHNLLADWKANLTDDDEISPRTRQTLHRWDLDRDYDRSPAEAYVRMQDTAARNPEPELLFALAEISYLLGRQEDKNHGQHACAFYYLSAGYAYHYLFNPKTETLDSYDPRFRLACDMYNTGLARCIRSAQGVGRLDPRQQLNLPTPDGRGFALSVVHRDFPWKPEEFGPLLFCSDFQVVGLTNNYRSYGLGVALIGTRLASADPGGTPKSALRYPREVSFPVSAFFHFEGTPADLRTARAGRLELFNPFVTQTVHVDGKPVPLETDLTTPLAYFLSRTDLEGVDYAGLFLADRVANRAGIYAFEPYQPGKIPVVMVHGLLSSPLTWTTMFNDLRADPTLRQRYQFWFYLYPTGIPYLETAADLRRTLDRVRQELDPQGRDAALNRMVFVGHSMGGLVSRLLTEDSGDDFWRLVSSKPFESIKVRAETKSEIKPVFFFEREPDVRRVIFLGTPHRGSKLSPSPLGRVTTQLIRLPKTLMESAAELAQADPNGVTGLKKGKVPTSVDLLAPGSPALEALAARPKPAGVHYHSIIGESDGAGEEASDGVVPYKSAHLDIAESELIVPASHSAVHQHPRAVMEVKRILLEHLRGSD